MLTLYIKSLMFKNTVKTMCNIITIIYIYENVIYSCDGAMLNFQQSTVPHDPSEIILISEIKKHLLLF